ncbi:SH3 domain-containing protein 2-like [Cocos nucifera]|nr:SH3 domain-containing protein 2-like [Cocos nucifera]
MVDNISCSKAKSVLDHNRYETQSDIGLVWYQYANVFSCYSIVFMLFIVAIRARAVLKQFGGGGYGGSENVLMDELELQQHQRLEKLYKSTHLGKHFQRDIVRGVEGCVVTGSKQVEIGSKLSEDGKSYGVENSCTIGSTLSNAALCFGRARAQIEQERGNLLKALGTQVAEPLRAMVVGAPLRDARELAQRYERMRQEAEVQAIEVSKRQIKVSEAPGNVDNVLKMEVAVAKLQQLKSNMTVLGKEAVSAMTAVEAQQQRLTLQHFLSMVELERTYHQRILQILDQLEREVGDHATHQRIEASSSPVVEDPKPPPPSYEQSNSIFYSGRVDGSTASMTYFLGEAESDIELNLSVGDYVIVRKDPQRLWGGLCERPTSLLLGGSCLHGNLGSCSLNGEFDLDKLEAMEKEKKKKVLKKAVVGLEKVSEIASVIGKSRVKRLWGLEAAKVSTNGWAEGECKGKAGWFPYGYIERRERVLASKIAEVY